ncbi:MAG: hypothetical protein PVG14_07805 [Anaerolineales bacterium]
MKNWRLGLNLLSLLAVVLIAIAMYQPWWSFTLQENKTTDVYPYLIDGAGSEMIGYKRSPQMTLLTGVLIACILLTLIGSLLKSRSSRVMLAVAGVLTLLGTWRLLARVAGVAARFDIPIQGQGRAVYEGFAQIEVSTQLELGTYLVVAGGVLAILAALFHSRVRLGS